MRGFLFFILCLLFIGCVQSDLKGTTTEDSVLYDTESQVLFDDSNLRRLNIPKGTRVFLIDIDGCKPLSKDAEKLVYIMLQNKYGDFVNGYKACMPVRKIKWD